MISVIVSAAINLFCSCSKSLAPGRDTINPQPPIVAVTNDVEFWLTKSDQSALLQKQNAKLVFGTTANTYDNVLVDTTQTFQTIDGFGFALTGGSAYVINQLGATEKANLLKEIKNRLQFKDCWASCSIGKLTVFHCNTCVLKF